jgi:hypothetical protein
MIRTTDFFPARLLAAMSLAALAILATGCATTGKQWTEARGDRERGVVRVSYEFPEFHEPVVSDGEATKLALQRCETWGYDDAEPIAGQLRQCSNMDNGDCDLWRVTREFQCTRSVAQANFMAK